MTIEISNIIYEAALRAAREMGPDLLKMSCFVSNWQEQTAKATQDDQVAA